MSDYTIGQPRRNRRIRAISDHRGRWFHLLWYRNRWVLWSEADFLAFKSEEVAS